MSVFIKKLLMNRLSASNEVHTRADMAITALAKKISLLYCTYRLVLPGFKRQDEK